MALKKMTIVIDKRTGKEKRLLNPAEKGKKAAVEMKKGVHFTNFGDVKTDKNGKPKKLKDIEKAYRAGYLAARSDSAKCFNANERKKRTRVKTTSKYGKSNKKIGSLRFA